MAGKEQNGENANTAAPTGLNLHPKDRRAVRVKAGIGIAVAIAAVFIVGLIVWAIVTRKPAGVGGQADNSKPKTIKSAEAAGEAESDALFRSARSQRKASSETSATAVVPRDSSDSEGGDVADNLDLPPTKITQNGQARSGAQQGPPQKTPYELALEEAEREEEEARNAPIASRSGGSSNSSAGTTPGGPAAPAALQLADALRSGLPGQQASDAVAAAAGSVQDDQNKQTEKEAFLDRVRSKPESVYLPSTRTRPISPFEVKAGWDIPATLDQAINSDLPGEVRGLVKENVYDSATGRFLLIPQGSRVVGTYNHRVAYGQNGIQVAWTRLIYPDGSSIELGGMNGEDARGESGFRDKVDNHYKRLIGFALLTSAFTAGIELSQNQQSTAFGYPSNSQIVTQALGQQLGELGIGITNRNLNIQPTVKIPVGYRFNIRVNKDIAFAGPYRPS